MSSLKDLASLIMIPSLYKDGRLDTVKPLGNSIIHPDATGNNDGTDGTTPAEGNFTFSRGSNLAATRVDVNGLIEKGRENLLLQSNQFDTTWLQTNTTLTSGQSGYNGNDAWKVASASGGQTGMQQNISFSNIHTFSIYAKAGSVDFLKLFVVQSGTNRNCVIDLSDGSIASEVKANSSPEASVTSLANGWYRIEMPTNANSATFVRIRPHLSVSDENLSVGDFIYIQDSQIETSLVATDYIETGASTAQAGILEDMPRLDYSGGASCPSLLLEPQRSNIVTQSDANANWNMVANVTNALTKDVLSPEGVYNAWSARRNVNTSGYTYMTNLPVSTNTTYTASIWLKANDLSVCDAVVMNFHPNSFASKSTILSFEDGSVTGDGIVEPYPNGWYRVSLTSTSNASIGYFDIGLQPLLNGDVYWGGSDGDVLWYAYGTQVEQGSYPTSYIPTYGSSVTRSADYMQVIPTDLLGSDSGTWFMELNDMTFNIAGTQVPTIYLGDSTTNCLAIEPKSAANNKGIFLVKEESNVSTTLYDFTISGKTKFCFVWSGTTLKVFRDGVQRYSATNFTQPANWDSFVFNHGTREAFSEIPSILLFPTALTDSECIALTTL